MPNERLRGAITAIGLTNSRLAEKLSVDPKTVERWVTQDRVPHPRVRALLTQLLGHDEAYLWPSLLTGGRAAGASRDEFVQLWPSRTDVPQDVWRKLMLQPGSVDILAYAAGFLVESLGLATAATAKAQAGDEVRILLGDPESAAVQQRAREEGLATLPERCRSTLEYLAPAFGVPGVSIRTHETPLYNSIYRFGSSMLINTHVYGVYAAKAPVQQLQQVPGGQLFRLYSESFNAAWATGRPAERSSR